MPKYAHYYVNAFVAAARERPDGGTQASSPAPATGASQLESKERSHFRASCLSSLAEVCQLLRWSLGRFSQVKTINNVSSCACVCFRLVLCSLARVNLLTLSPTSLPTI